MRTEGRGHFLGAQLLGNVTGLKLHPSDGSSHSAAFVAHEPHLFAVKLGNETPPAIYSRTLMGNDRVIVAGGGSHGALLRMRSATDPDLYARDIRILVSSASLASSQARSACGSHDASASWRVKQVSRV